MKLIGKCGFDIREGGDLQRMHEVVEGFVVVGAHAQGGVVHEREGRCDTQVCECDRQVCQSVTDTHVRECGTHAAAAHASASRSLTARLLASTG